MRFAGRWSLPALQAATERHGHQHRQPRCRHERAGAARPIRQGDQGAGAGTAAAWVRRRRHRVSPYSDTFGGCVLNATLGMFAHCSIEVRSDRKVKFTALDYEQEVEADVDEELIPSGRLALHKAVHRRIVRQFLGGASLPVTVMTASDAPAGSGLGSSSTLVVAMIEAYRELLALPLGEYDVAHLAYMIERVDVGQAGGRQDQYAATFGGINFIEFSAEQAIVNPLRIRRSTLMELEAMLVLYLTGISRESAQDYHPAVRKPAQRPRGVAAGNAPDQARRLCHEGCAAAQRPRRVQRTLARSWEAKKRTARASAMARSTGCRYCAVGRCIVGQGLGRRRWRFPVLHGAAGTSAAPVAALGRAGHHHALRLHRGRCPGVAGASPRPSTRPSGCPLDAESRDVPCVDDRQ